MTNKNKLSSNDLEKNIAEDGKDVIIQKNLVYKVQISSSLKSEYKNKVFF